MGITPLRLRPRSIRGRIALLTVATTTLVLVPIAVITILVIESTGLVNLVITGDTIILIALTGSATWALVGRALQPVDAIRAQLADITFNDLSGRIPQPPGSDEVSELARTANLTLGRLELAVRGRQQAVTDATHELRTPLAGLRLQMEEAQLHPADTHLPELLANMLGDVDRLQRIVTDLLYLAGIEATGAQGRKRLDLARLVRTELAHRRDRHPVGLALDEEVTVDGVPEQIGRALANLLDNAQRHAQHGVDVRVCLDGDSALLAVSDDGHGIAENRAQEIFNPFARVDTARSRDRGGAGLGLAITSAVVRVHHGTIRVRESPTGGACIELRFPCEGAFTGVL
ncbi:two-component sensor histidine kinase [Sphaerisporangium album]|uniref:histidine kinase n=1 Tax=Sphaerisporangium album TaxID=509200 RepID=A0A367FGI1_9ACTN|nr:ATP-binding protein [Sphaerisporangium album]RCG29019.1 two-component sensor histidine kinase [Sphaerisporangium album]